MTGPCLSTEEARARRAVAVISAREDWLGGLIAPLDQFGWDALRQCLRGAGAGPLLDIEIAVGVCDKLFQSVPVFFGLTFDDSPHPMRFAVVLPADQLADRVTA